MAIVPVASAIRAKSIISLGIARWARQLHQLAPKRAGNRLRARVAR